MAAAGKIAHPTGAILSHFPDIFRLIRKNGGYLEQILAQPQYALNTITVLLKPSAAIAAFPTKSGGATIVARPVCTCFSRA
jgi:hypothetical protein